MAIGKCWQDCFTFATFPDRTNHAPGGLGKIMISKDMTVTRHLGTLARIVRSKNAGPGLLTIDLFFDTETDYADAVAAPGLQAAAVASRYRLSANQVRIIPYPPARAIKITMDRKQTAGRPGDYDVYGAQQHALLLDVEIPERHRQEAI